MPAGSPQLFPDLVKSRIATPEYHHGVERAPPHLVKAPPWLRRCGPGRSVLRPARDCYLDGLTRTAAPLTRSWAKSESAWLAWLRR
jgi:hypothetical protein